MTIRFFAETWIVVVKKEQSYIEVYGHYLWLYDICYWCGCLLSYSLFLFCILPFILSSCMKISVLWDEKKMFPSAKLKVFLQKIVRTILRSWLDSIIWMFFVKVYVNICVKKNSRYEGKSITTAKLVSFSAHCWNHSWQASPRCFPYTIATRVKLHAMRDMAVGIRFAYIGQVSWGYTTPGSRPASKALPYQTPR